MANGTLVDVLRYGVKLPGTLVKISTTNIPMVASVHNKTQAGAKISITVYKALRAYALAKEGSLNGIGYDQDGNILAEMHNNMSNTVDLALCLTTSNGLSFKAGTLHKDTKQIEQFVVGPSHRYGTVLLFIALPKLMECSELQGCFTNLQQYLVMAPETIPDDKDILDFIEHELAIASDNIYRRLNGTSADKAYNLKIQIPKTGNIPPLSPIAIKKYTAVKVEVGVLSEFVNKKTGVTSKTVIDASTFVGRYANNPNREFTEEEKSLIPVLRPSDVITQEALSVAKASLASKALPKAMNNVLIMGPPGTGKTEAARQISIAKHIPHVTLVCNSETEFFDLIGQTLPIMDDDTIPENLPTIDDIIFDMEGAYEQLTGEPMPAGTEQADVVALLYEAKAKKETAGQYQYVKSDVLKAFQYGWGIEIQEADVIKKQTVLTGLNALLEYGSITLPNGERIERHPDCMVYMTINGDAYGCKKLNQAVLSRMNFVLEMQEPSIDIQVERAMKNTNCPEQFRAEVTEMAELLARIREYCDENDIKDGVCGLRELYNWLELTLLTQDVKLAFEQTVKHKMTTDAMEKEEIMTAVVNINPMPTFIFTN